MKLCPQCEFIYEDDQSVCDMDGKNLVYDPGPLAIEELVRSTSPELHDTAPLPVSLTASLPSQPTRWQSRRSAVAALVAIILVALLFVVYYARTHQLRSVNAKQASNQTSIQPSNQSTQRATATQEPAPDLASAPPESLTPLTPSSEQSSSGSENVTTSSPSSVSISSATFNRGRMTHPVSAGGSAPEGRAPVIVWLTNGASIKADEAWEKREGIWYRQAGMVTFLKRSRVRAIQRLGAPNPRPKSPAINGEEQNRSAIAQNQPRIFKPEAATTKPEAAITKPAAATTKLAAAPTKAEAATAKKDSRVSSFLKKTGRILKKPFRF